MGKIVEKKKKKGRPSLLDIQKRNLREQQEQHEQQIKQQEGQQTKKPNSAQNSSHNKKTDTPTTSSLRRSTRGNPISSPEQPVEDENGDELTGEKCREKKAKVVANGNLDEDENKSPIQSAASEAEGEDENAASNYKKRKIDAIADRSKEEGDKALSRSNLANNAQGSTPPLVSGPSTPLPDKKLLLFVLDRVQKKDTYGVFSEPVDPEELPDYHEVIEHPMDFKTVREKLSSGAYTKLEEFEDDVFLITSNGMQYNAPDTVYFRQARSIQELAKKTFENLRQDSDDNEAEPKIVRRGRPPTKFRKSMDGPSVEPTGSESEATFAIIVESTSLSNYAIRRGPLVESGFADSSGRVRNDVYTSGLMENKYDRNDETTGSMFKGNSLRHGKKQTVLDESSRRNTYKQSLLSFGGRELSVLTTFDSERKQLMAVGLFSEYSYARSLARFAANLGPLAWKIASKKIGKGLPAGLKFGPGWVGENDIPPQSQSLTLTDPEGNKSSEKLEKDYLCDSSSNPPLSSTTSPRSSLHSQPFWKGSSQQQASSPQQKPNSVPPPDLNVQFQSPYSPT